MKRYETDIPAGDQIDCYLSCIIRINKGELKKKEKKRTEVIPEPPYVCIYLEVANGAYKPLFLEIALFYVMGGSKTLAHIKAYFQVSLY